MITVVQVKKNKYGTSQVLYDTGYIYYHIYDGMLIRDIVSVRCRIYKFSFGQNLQLLSPPK